MTYTYEFQKWEKLMEVEIKKDNEVYGESHIGYTRRIPKWEDIYRDFELRKKEQKTQVGYRRRMPRWEDVYRPLHVRKEEEEVKPKNYDSFDCFSLYDIEDEEDYLVSDEELCNSQSPEYLSETGIQDEENALVSDEELYDSQTPDSQSETFDEDEVLTTLLEENPVFGFDEEILKHVVDNSLSISLNNLKLTSDTDEGVDGDRMDMEP
ncbi:hypothetical protein MPTK1_6g13640 [Marchantia polymorpha subsp. ruderalis]|uniref:Uncharacterized protein n=2 Tax=Marchantia polymorpha TaxID=3197 RepID=A0AAF6BRQ1_MARPO|nr:hypothetical protein MARPO_0047s0015 [Marchantia polymorpha]BBN14685.1 hypothetical protein Mp_6g13640 [Marchantia polymorpha subsp. ruderalis]|eukprot:PTQ39023.1 hypothetical protein MARPO_0047s0015 [Marchantia polymorpha]